MAIPKFQLDRKRNVIAIFGEIPNEAEKTFTAQGYSCKEIPPSITPENIWFQQVDSIIILQDARQPKRAVDFLVQFSQTLLATDCRIYFRCATQEVVLSRLQMRELVIDAITTHELPAIRLSSTDRERLGSWSIVADLPELCPYVDISEDKEDWAMLSSRILHNPSGNLPAAALDIQALDTNKRKIDLPSEVTLLLKRAFDDCRKIELEEIGHGKSEAKAYRAFAKLQKSHLGDAWPYQYFVKIGKRSVIAKEYLNYRDTVLDQIPFHLGPRLREERCVLGCKLGVMVSDYVSNADALSEIAKSGQAGAAVSSLLLHTVGAWRNGDSAEKEDIKEFLLSIFPKGGIPDFRLPLVEKLGHKPTHDDLHNTLNRYSSSPTLVGVIHGDMHAKNILVRGHDAILVDFEKLQKRSPVLHDIASIEAGLLDDCFYNDGRTAAELHSFLKPLYCYYAFSQDHPKEAPPTPGHWYFQDVRFIRTQAKSLERQNLQYAWMLAVVMLKKACKDENLDEIHAQWGDKPKGLSAENVRAVMYVLAAELINSLPTVKE